MKYKLSLVASDESGNASLQEVELSISADSMLGLPDSPKSALDVVIEKLSEIPGFSVS